VFSALLSIGLPNGVAFELAVQRIKYKLRCRSETAFSFTCGRAAQVTSLARIDLQTSDKIEQGSSVPLTVRLLDSAGRPLDASVLAFVELRPVLGSASVVAVAPAAADDLRHTLTGLTLGQTTVAFSSGAITSGFVNVQVFAPLQLSPRNITLVIGATFQVVRSL